MVEVIPSAGQCEGNGQHEPNLLDQTARASRERTRGVCWRLSPRTGLSSKDTSAYNLARITTKRL